MARQARERKAAQKFERESLEPLAGVKQPRTISDIFRELNRRGELPNIAQRLGDQNQALIKNLTLIRDRAAPDAFGGMSDLGRQVIDGYLAIDRVRNDNISKLYSELRDAAGGQFPIDAQKFVNNADQTLRKQLKSEFLPPDPHSF